MIDDKRLNEICLIGQGSICCRYIVVGPDGFECAKTQPTLKRTIDSRVQNMTAKGDNCEGVRVK